MIVADTNLIVNLTLVGDRHPEAERVRQRDPDWVAPALWASEFRNVLVTYVRVGRLTPERAKAAWPVALGLVQDVDVDPLQALDAAFAYGLSGYDAEFVAVAETLGTRLVTDDKGVLKACPETAVSLDDFAASDATGR